MIAIGLVALLAAAVGAGGVVLASNGDGGGGSTAADAKPIPGRPLLVLRLPGRPLSGHPTAAAVLRAAQARLPQDDLRVQVGKLVVAYRPSQPESTLRALRELSQQEPVVLLNLGIVQAWSGDRAGAVALWRKTRSLDPYGYYGTIADNLLHPEQALGYPVYIAPRSFGAGSVQQLRAQAQAHPDQAARWLALAVALERDDRAGAQRAAARAAQLDPTGISSRVAAIVLGYDKDSPQAAFGQLGPLLQQSSDPDGEIRFHIALLSLQIGLRDKALGELRQVLREHPDGPYAKLAAALVDKLEQS